MTGAQGHEERGSDNAASTLVEVLRCGSIQIMPRHVFELQVQGGAQYSISNVRVTERGRQKRVAWDLGGIGSREGWPSSMPWSDITGPFHCFTIFRGKTFIGTSFCTEFPLKDEDFGDGSEAMGSERFTVRGRCFGGLEVVEQSITG